MLCDCVKFARDLFVQNVLLADRQGAALLDQVFHIGAVWFILDLKVFSVHYGGLQHRLPFDKGRGLEDTNEFFKDHLVVDRGQDLHERCKLLERHQLLPWAEVDSGCDQLVLLGAADLVGDGAEPHQVV